MKFRRARCAGCGCSRDWGAVLAADSWEPCCSPWSQAAIRLEVLMEICDAGELCQARRAPEQCSDSCSELSSCAASSGSYNPSLVLKGQMTLSCFLAFFFSSFFQTSEQWPKLFNFFLYKRDTSISYSLSRLPKCTMCKNVTCSPSPSQLSLTSALQCLTELNLGG